MRKVGIVVAALLVVVALASSSSACNPATAVAFNQALNANFNPYGFGSPNFATPNLGCGAGYNMGVGMPVRTVTTTYQARVGVPVRTMNYNNSGFAAPGGFAPMGFGGGNITINARRIRGNNFGSLGAAAANGANVNINARRIRRNSF